MKLEEYLEQENKDLKMFAEEVGVHVESVKAWLKGKWHPNSNTQRRILEATNGQVTANDFYQ